jgi:pimeloyl-ACP methyl ester carboxylesterase
MRAETDSMTPETLYAKTSDDVWIAYQTLGDGPVDLIVVFSWVSHLEVYWEQPRIAKMLGSFAKDARVITFDKRGTGLSDRISRVPDLEARMDDIRAVMDAVGSQRATLFGMGDGAALAALFAATYPERSAGLILYGGNARMTWAPDYPWGLTEDAWIREHARIPEIWGRERYGREWAEISLLLERGDPDDPELFRWAAKWHGTPQRPATCSRSVTCGHTPTFATSCPRSRCRRRSSTERASIPAKPSTSRHGSPGRSSMRSLALVASHG